MRTTRCMIVGLTIVRLTMMLAVLVLSGCAGGITGKEPHMPLPEASFQQGMREVAQVVRNPVGFALRWSRLLAEAAERDAEAERRMEAQWERLMARRRERATSKD